MNSQSGGPCVLSENNLKIPPNLQITCEFTVGRPLQLIRIRPQTIPYSIILLNLPVNSQPNCTGLVFRLSQHYWPPQLATQSVQTPRIINFLKSSLEQAHSAHHEKIYRYPRKLEIPVNSQVDGPFSTPWEDRWISKVLQNACESTGGWPTQQIMRRVVDINDLGRYLWIHRWMAHSAYLKKAHLCRKKSLRRWLLVNSQANCQPQENKQSLQHITNHQFTCEFTGKLPTSRE